MSHLAFIIASPLVLAATPIGAGVAATLLACATIPLATRLLRPAGVVDRPGRALAVHTGSVPRLGGVGIAAALALVLPMLRGSGPGTAFGAVVAPALALFCLGLADDRFDLPAPPRFIAQLLLASVTALLFPSPVIFAALALAASANALNWLDGLDGLAGGVALIGFAGAALAFHALGVRDWCNASAAIAGALLAFLAFNLSRGPSKVFLGDCGSMTLGFMLGCVALRLESAAPHARAAGWLFVAVPLVELGSTLARRALGRRPLFAGDRAHSYDVLHTRLRLPLVLALFWSAAAAAAALALSWILEV